MSRIDQIVTNMLCYYLIAIIYNKNSISCLNKGLGRGQLCIYSSVDTHNNGSSLNIGNHSFKVFIINRIFKDGNDK